MLKQVIYILILLIFISCNIKKEEIKTKDSIVNVKTVLLVKNSLVHDKKTTTS